MTIETLIAILMLGTLLAIAIFALISINRTEKRRKDKSVPKSTLAADKPSSGKPVDV